MIRFLIFLLAIVIVLGVGYLATNLLLNTTGHAIAAATKNQILKWDYHISSFNIGNYTKIVLVFNKEFNYSCINNVKIDNLTVEYSKSYKNNILEINLNKRIYGMHQIEIEFCEGKLVDTIIVQ